MKKLDKKQDSPAKMVKKSPAYQTKSVIDSKMRENKTSPTKMKEC
jgi:hypothetical protein